MGAFVIQECQPHLLKVVAALRTPCGLPCRLHGRQEKSYQDADDGDHHQEFDKRERSTTTTTIIVGTDRALFRSYYPSIPCLDKAGWTTEGSIHAVESDRPLSQDFRDRKAAIPHTAIAISRPAVGSGAWLVDTTGVPAKP